MALPHSSPAVLCVRVPRQFDAREERRCRSRKHFRYRRFLLPFLSLHAFHRQLPQGELGSGGAVNEDAHAITEAPFEHLWAGALGGEMHALGGDVA